MTAAPQYKKVTLPGGEVVKVSLTWDHWWDKQNASGYVHPSMLAPDPGQPRKHMNPDELAELTQSIAASGVREAITVTPRSKAPWARVAPEDEHKPFLIVSGHRRDRGALGAKLEAVPILVRIYDSKKEHHIDRSLLNYGHQALTEIEQGYEAISLRDEDGWSIKELCDRFAVATPALYARMYLTRLDPSIQLLLDPKLPYKRRLGTRTGGALGSIKTPTPDELLELCEMFSESVKGDVILSKAEIGALGDDGRRFALQKLLLAIIQKKSLPAERAVEFIREQTFQLKATQLTPGRHNAERRFEPKRRQELLTGLVKMVRSSAVMDWRPDEFKRIFEYATFEALDAFIKEFQSIIDFLSGLVKILKDIQATKKPTHAAILELDAKKKS